MNQIVKTWRDIVDITNNRALRKENNLLAELSASLRRKDTEIRDASRELNRAREKLREGYEEIGYVCHKDPENCIDSAISQIESQIESRIRDSLDEKEKELVYAEEQIQAAGDPAKEMKQTAQSMYQNLKTSYGHREQFLSITEVNSSRIAGERRKAGYYISREPNKVILYPFTTVSDGQLRLLMVMDFRVRSSEGGPIGRGPLSGPLTGMAFIPISPGTFMMGSPSNESGRDNDEKQHRVTLTKGYYMQTTEVTQRQWKAVMGSNPSGFKNCGDDCPVEKVSWKDVQAFIEKLNQREGGNKYRLPTEAEWEYAARAGSTTRFSFGDNEGRLGEYAWYNSNSGSKTHSVGQKRPNAWGLYDMHGNVREWCQDWYDDYPSGSVTDPTGPHSGSRRVLRGGSWNYVPRGVRGAYRNFFSPGNRLSDMGFRLLRTD